jgi:hypothetical protein
VDELYDWLVADLGANTKPVIFISGHEPAYPEYRHVGDSLDKYPAHRDRFWKFLNDEQVMAYFCGHTHWYYAKQVDGDWATFTWQIDVGNAGNIAEPAQTFVDVTVTDTDVTFNTWQGTEEVAFTIVESWTVDIPTPPYKAYKPTPADRSSHLETWVTLSWNIGAGAVSHDVYFGENFDDVNNGTGGTFRGSQTETSFTVGLAGSPYPDGLPPETTYYWRIDDVNELDPNSPYKGDVWRFNVLSVPDLVGWWKLDETEGSIAYDGVWNNDGIVNGEPLWQPAGGQVDGALAFDGIDDYVGMPFILDPADAVFSIFAWIKGAAPGQVIISQIGGANWLLANPSEGKLQTSLLRPAGGRFAPQSLISEFIITDGSWHHVGLTWDGSNKILYADGAEVARDTHAAMEGSAGGLYIGAGKNLEAGSFFSGLIDDVRIYDRALSAEDIAALPH